MPTRVIRDGINNSARINALSDGAELFYRRLLSVVDDYGRYYAHPTKLRMDCWPTNPDRHKDGNVRTWLAECCAGPRPLVTIYTVDGVTYLQLDAFGQKVRSKPKFPNPPTIAAQSANSLSTSCHQAADNPPTNCGEKSRPSREAKAKAIGEGGGGVSPLASPPPLHPDVEKLRDLLIDYGVEVGRDYGRPDDAICKRILAACRGDLAGLYQVMRAKLDIGKVPNSLGLFVEFAKEVPHS